MPDEEIPFPEFRLKINTDDRSAHAYKTRDWYEEVTSTFYGQIAEHLKPELCIDIGANFGAVSLILKTNMPDVPLISVEPNTQLHPYIEHNLEPFKDKGWTFVKAMVGREESGNNSFHVNPAGSQDSRVIAASPNWIEIQTPVTTLEKLVGAEATEKRVYIKIDTQGFEREIFEGSEAYLCSSSNWLIRTEFAPDWMKSQGADPREFLRWLVDNFNVVEFPGRYGFRGDLCSLLKDAALQSDEVDAFFDYCIGLNRHDRGWVDLLLCPRSSSLLS